MAPVYYLLRDGDAKIRACWPMLRYRAASYLSAMAFRLRTRKHARKDRCRHAFAYLYAARHMRAAARYAHDAHHFTTPISRHMILAR